MGNHRRNELMEFITAFTIQMKRYFLNTMLLLVLPLVACASEAAEPPPTPPSLISSPTPEVTITVPPEPTVAPEVNDARTAEAMAVYRALLDENMGYTSGPHLLLMQNSVNIQHFFEPMDGADSTYADVIEAVPTVSAETWADFAAQNQSSTDLAPLVDLERSLTFITSAEIDPFFQDDGGSVEAHWEAFHAAYPDSDGYTELSRIGFNATMTQALAYTEVWCGAECGAGTIFVLEKQGNRWVKIGERVMWLS